MEKVLLSIIAASGLCAVSSQAVRRYHFVYELKNMTEAQSYCREKYHDLATIHNMEDVNVLNNLADFSKMVYSEYSYRAWIGLYDDRNSWRWSLDDNSFYRHGEAEFRNWADSQPDSWKSNEHCASMYDTGRWNDISCQSKFQSICFDARGLNETFVFINNLMTWTEAQSYCRKHYTDLAIVRNMAENQKVKELVSPGKMPWIGLYRDAWKWSDGSNSAFRYWNKAAGEPNNYYWNESCVAADFNQSGQWEDTNCDWKRAFICYKKFVPVSKQVIKVRLQKSSSVDLNDPAVMEDILKQVKQNLKGQGLNEDIKLSWKKQSDGKVFHKDEEETKKRKKDEL